MSRTGLALLLAGAVVVGASCAGPRNTLGTTNEPCFRAIAVAKSAVHHGKLVGVRHERLDRFRRRVPEAADIKHRFVCLVAFEGPYEKGTVEMARPDRSGRYAVVAVNTRGFRPVMVIIADRLPLRFRQL